MRKLNNNMCDNIETLRPMIDILCDKAVTWNFHDH